MTKLTLSPVRSPRSARRSAVRPILFAVAFVGCCATFAMALVSCSKQTDPTPPEPQQILFSSGVNIATKLPVETETMDGLTFAILRGKDGATNDFTTTLNRFTAKSKVTDDLETITPSVAQIFNIGGATANFLAYYPPLEGTMDGDGNYVIDLSYSSGVSPGAMRDVMIARPTTATIASPACKLKFEHLMTMFELQMKMLTKEDSIAYGKLKTAGTNLVGGMRLTIQPKGTEVFECIGSNSLTHNYLAGYVEIPYDKFLSIGKVMFHPQNPSASLRKIVVTFENKPGFTWWDITGLPETLEAGKKYVIKATVGRAGITFETSVVPWETADESGSTDVVS